MGAREASATEGGVGCGGGDGMRRCGQGEWRGRAGVDDDNGTAQLDAAGRGRDEIDVVDRKVEDEQRNRSIYIGRDPLVLAGNTNRD